MITADIDQISVLNMYLFSKYMKRCISNAAEIGFPNDITFLPKEIYNIVSIKKINLSGTKSMLVISNKIINLRNIVELYIQDSPNIIISRNILMLKNKIVIWCGYDWNTYCRVSSRANNYINIISKYFINNKFVSNYFNV